MRLIPPPAWLIPIEFKWASQPSIPNNHKAWFIKYQVSTKEVSLLVSESIINSIHIDKLVLISAYFRSARIYYPRVYNQGYFWEELQRRSYRWGQPTDPELATEANIHKWKLDSFVCNTSCSPYKLLPQPKLIFFSKGNPTPTQRR